MANKFYNRTFQKLLHQTSSSSAEQIVPFVMELVQPMSVVDIGCGIGAWLAAFRDIGHIKDYIGLDGNYMQTDHFLIEPDHFIECDLEKMEISFHRTFDLACSLEVAEHLTQGKAKLFVKYLTQLAPVVLFSAAIPNQGGTNHINEQWPNYWANLFSQHNYVPVDCIRKKFWNDEKVAWWYAQNMILYVHEDCLKEYPKILNNYDPQNNPPLSLVHPLGIKRDIFYRIVRKIKKIFFK